MRYAFLYTGQGSQKAGMGRDFYEKFKKYREIADDAPADYLEVMHTGSAELLAKTEYTQPCMSIFAAGVTELLEEHGITPSVALGLSLGEYGALYAAGVYGRSDYLAMTEYRGRIMAETASGLECAMSAILGSDANTVQKICGEVQPYVTVANYNCPGQYVICGDEGAVSAAEDLLRQSGAKRCVRLKVSGPFHTKYMEPAAVKMQTYLENIEFKQPRIPVILNLTGEICPVDTDLKWSLTEQIRSSVQMEKSLNTLLESAMADCFIEIGPGNTMTGFLKKCAKKLEKDIRFYTIETADGFEKMLMEENL